MKLNSLRTARTAKEAAEKLQSVADDAHKIASRANSDDYTGFGAGGGNGRRSGVSDPTAAAALAQRNRTHELAVGQFRDALWEAKQAADRVYKLGQSLLLTRAEAEKAERQKANASGTCANPACRCEVLNTPNDRLREGRCEACYRWRKDHYGNERPRELCHPEQEATG